MATREIHTQDPAKLTTLSVQLPNRFTLLIHEAAQKSGAKSTALYIGQAVLDKACDDLGIDHVDVAFIKAMATAERGKSLDAAEFMRRAVAHVDKAATEPEARRILRTAEELIKRKFGEQGERSGDSGARLRASALPASSTKKRNK